MTKPLLPTGCYDVLPPFARAERLRMGALMDTFEAFGYQQVSPPLLEYTESLLAGRGAALSAQTLRMMDPAFHKVMGIRADMTLQVARIAATRLADSAMPLRLSYGGLVLRTHGDSMEANRQLRQAGVELIGPASPEADAEVISVIAEALTRAGVADFVVDLTMPCIVQELLREDALSEPKLQEILQAIAHKDISAVQNSGLREKSVLAALMQLTGTAHEMLPKLQALPLPAGAKEHMETLTRVVSLLARSLPANARLTVDITESRGLNYHSGVTFSIFGQASAVQIAAGGRYVIDAESGPRPATGGTVYVNALRHVLPAPEAGLRVFIARSVDINTITQLQNQGFTTLNALPDYPTTREYAKTLGCTHYWDGDLTDL